MTRSGPSKVFSPLIRGFQLLLVYFALHSQSKSSGPNRRRLQKKCIGIKSAFVLLPAQKLYVFFGILLTYVSTCWLTCFNITWPSCADTACSSHYLRAFRTFVLCDISPLFKSLVVRRRTLGTLMNIIAGGLY